MWPFDQIVDLLNQQRLTKRDKDCIRQLVAQEVDLNFGRLKQFFGQLVIQRQNFKAIATHADLVIGDPPTWERVRWDGAPILLARSLSQHELLRVARWYTELDQVSRTFRHITQQSALLRNSGTKAVGPLISEDYIAEHMLSLLKATARLVDARRPIVHHAVEKARNAIRAGEPVSTLVSIVDPEEPSIYQYDGKRWIPITAAAILEQYANVPLEHRST